MYAVARKQIPVLVLCAEGQAAAFEGISNDLLTGAPLPAVKSRSQLMYFCFGVINAMGTLHLIVDA
jgi:hypothetical protein